METILKLFGYKGDRSTFSVKAATERAGEMVTFLTGKTYAGGQEFSAITTGLEDPGLTVNTTIAPFNDMDVKCLLTFKNRSDPTNMTLVRVTIPAPIIDAANGIATEVSDEKRYVPATKASGALGDDGNTMATAVETMLGLSAGDLKFMSGVFIKKSA